MASHRLEAQITPVPGMPTSSRARKQSKWSSDEDAKIVQFRGEGMKWEDISKELPGRSALSCRLHYQNYLERRAELDEDHMNKLAQLYYRFSLADIWSRVAQEMGIPWRVAEAMHWQMGERDMARRVGVTPFTMANSNNNHAVNIGPNTQSLHGPVASIAGLGGHHHNSGLTSSQSGHLQQVPSFAVLTAGLRLSPLLGAQNVGGRSRTASPCPEEPDHRSSLPCTVPGFYFPSPRPPSAPVALPSIDRKRLRLESGIPNSS